VEGKRKPLPIALEIGIFKYSRGSAGAVGGDTADDGRPEQPKERTFVPLLPATLEKQGAQWVCPHTGGETKQQNWRPGKGGRGIFLRGFFQRADNSREAEIEGAY